MPVRLANGRFAKKGSPEYNAGMASNSFIDVEKIQKAAVKASFENLGQAGANIRLVARQSIKESSRPADPGQPVHTRHGLMKAAILYDVNKQSGHLFVGPSADVVGPAAVPHEYGGAFRGKTYAARPFMGPAYEKLKPRLEKFWADTIK